MSAWKRKPKKLDKSLDIKPEEKKSIIDEFISKMTYNKTDEEKKKTLTEMSPDKKVEAVPVIIAGQTPDAPNVGNSKAVTQAAPQQITINVNIPSAALNKSDMPAEHKADMPKAPPLPTVPKPKTSAPKAPTMRVSVTTSMTKSIEELAKELKPGKNLTKNMNAAAPTIPQSNVPQPMQMSEEEKPKTAWRVKPRDATQVDSTQKDERPYGDLGKLKDSVKRINKLHEDLKSEPLKKDVVDMSKWKRKGKTEEPKRLHEDPLIDTLMQPNKSKSGVDTRSSAQKIKDALDKQDKNGSPYASGRKTGGGSASGKKTKEIKDLSREEIDAGLKKIRESKQERPSNTELPRPNEDAKGYLMGRFRDSPEMTKRVEELWSKDNDEPYNDGILGQTIWSKGDRDIGASAADEMPIASKTSPQSIGGILGKKVITGEGPDPLHMVDMKYGTTKRVLEDHKDLPLKIHTRSDLIANDDYMDKLNPQKHEVNIHVAFPENKWDFSSVENFMEPGQPSTKRRLLAYQKLKAAGIPTKIIVDRLKSDHEHPILTDNKGAASQLIQMGVPKEDIDFNEINLDEHALNRISEKTGRPPYKRSNTKHLSSEEKAANLDKIKQALARRTR